MSGIKFRELIASVNEEIKNEVKIMEVCGTHTQVIAKAGFTDMLNPKIKLVSGPGCPICVTPEGYIDAAIKILRQPNTIIATFGDLIRVRGRLNSLEDCMELKSRIKIVYSPFAALDIAAYNCSQQVVFLAVGFETTAPLIAAVAKLAQERGLKNLTFLMGLKLMPPVLEQVLPSGGMRLDALLCPGHVSAIMGSDYFNFVAQKYGVPAVVCGFESSDILISIQYLVSQTNNGWKGFENLYSRCVKPRGNVIAKELLKEVFQSKEGYWRGIGSLEHSELTFQKQYADFDAAKRLDIEIDISEAITNCKCAEVIIGNKAPFQCNMFGSVCSIESPMGPCMISSEGACAIYYKYNRRNMQ